MSRSRLTTSFLSVARRVYLGERVVWALLKGRAGEFTAYKRSVAPKGQHPRNLSGSKTAHAMATLEPWVTEGEAARTSETRYLHTRGGDR
jgi:hypothetical protein